MACGDNEVPDPPDGSQRAQAQDRWALKCNGEPLAPRTVRRIYGTVRVLFKSAVIDEHIAASPVLLEANVLPMDIDKDPEWRSTAVFEREELISLISDDRIPDDRRVQYALEGIAGVRHGGGRRASDPLVQPAPRAARLPHRGPIRHQEADQDAAHAGDPGSPDARGHPR